MEQISIYLASSVEKRFIIQDKKTFIDNEIKQQIVDGLQGFDVLLFDPNTSMRLSNSNARFGRDLLQVKSSKFLIIDLREKRGIGVGAEMMVAKIYHTPVIAVCPPESHYKRTTTDNRDWIHPFVSALSDVVVHDFKEASAWIKEFMANPTAIKSFTEIEKFINLYKDTDMNSDELFLKNYNRLAK